MLVASIIAGIVVLILVLALIKLFSSKSFTDLAKLDFTGSMRLLMYGVPFLAGMLGYLGGTYTGYIRE